MDDVLYLVSFLLVAHYQEIPSRTDRLGPVLIRRSQAGKVPGTVQALQLDVSYKF